MIKFELFDLYNLKEMSLSPELFLSSSILQFTFFAVSTAYQRKSGYVLLNTQVYYIGFLLLIFTLALLLNEGLETLNTFTSSNSIVNDYLSFGSKVSICLVSLLFLMVAKICIKQFSVYNNFEYIILIIVSILGLFLMCSANDLLTAYLAIELQSVAFYIMAAFKKDSSYSVESGLKYFIIGSFSSGLLLLGSAFLYGCFGTLNFNDFQLFSSLLEIKRDAYNPMLSNSISGNPIQEILKNIPFSSSSSEDYLYLSYLKEVSLHYPVMLEPVSYNFQSFEFDLSLAKIGFGLIFLSLFVKLSIAPFHFWSLDVYEGSPNVTTVFFAVVPKIALFVLLIRICYISFYTNLFYDYQTYFFLLALFSVLIGSLGGLEQRKIKTLFAYSCVSHTGYMLLAFSTGHLESIFFMFYYLVIYMMSGLCFWSIYLFLNRFQNIYYKKGNKELGDFVLLKASNPTLAFCLALTLFSIAGIPPVIGFLAKAGVFLTAMNSSAYVIAVFSILFSVISTFYYIRFIKILYFENVLVGNLYIPISTNESLIIACLTFFLVLFCINPSVLYLSFVKGGLLL